MRISIFLWSLSWRLRYASCQDRERAHGRPKRARSGPIPHGSSTNEAVLDAWSEGFVRTDPKSRYSLVDNWRTGMLIRRNRGHAGKVADMIDVARFLTPIATAKEAGVKVLAHGTSLEAWEHIKCGEASGSRSTVEVAQPGQSM